MRSTVYRRSARCVPPLPSARHGALRRSYVATPPLSANQANIVESDPVDNGAATRSAEAEKVCTPPPPGPQQEDVGNDAMTRRLQSLSEENSAGTRVDDIEAAGFSEDLKRELLERVAASKGSPRTHFPSAFATVEAPSSAGQGARHIAAADTWHGTQSVSDAALRMLDDSHRRIRVPSRPSGPAARPPSRIDTGRPGKSAISQRSDSGARLANARDKTSTYTFLKDESLTPQEKEKMRKELKGRFSPGARPMPRTLQGLSSLANERIEDAIARGQFKDLPSRGKKIERDYNASSPFLDTTEVSLDAAGLGVRHRFRTSNPGHGMLRDQAVLGRSTKCCAPSNSQANPPVPPPSFSPINMDC